MSDEIEQLPRSDTAPGILRQVDDYDERMAECDRLQRKIDEMKSDLAAVPIPSPS